MSLLLGMSASAAGALLGLWSRTRPPRPLAEAVPRSRIAELSPGRFAIVGRIVPLETELSSIDGARCVYLERVEVARDGLFRSLDHEIASHRFYLEDESGRLEVDPSRATLEVGTIVDESGRKAERRLRVGEEVELVCELRAEDGEGDRHLPAYRAGAGGVAIDYELPNSPALLRDTLDTRGLELEPRPPSRLAAGAAGAALSAWGLLLLLFSS